MVKVGRPRSAISTEFSARAWHRAPRAQPIISRQSSTVMRRPRNIFLAPSHRQLVDSDRAKASNLEIIIIYLSALQHKFFGGTISPPVALKIIGVAKMDR